jgi:hypothetical protein
MLYAHIGANWTWFLDPLRGDIVVPEVSLVRQNYYTLRVQAVRAGGFILNATGAASSGTVDLSGYDDVIFGMKEAADDTDFAAAWRGFNATDTAWHSLANGRFSIDVAPTTALDVQSFLGCGFRLLNGAEYFDVPDIALVVNLRQNLITGSEPSTPGGTTANDGTATIADGTDSVTVTDANMTTAGLIVPFFVGSPVSTISATAGTGNFTITIGGPASGNITVGYYIRKRS